MITKDEKSSLIANKISNKLIKTSLNSKKNELIHPALVSDNYSKSNHSLVTTNNNNTAKTVSTTKVVELDEKYVNTTRKRSTNLVIMNDIKKQRRHSQLLAKKLTIKGSNPGNTNDKDIDNLSKTDKGCRFTLVFDPNGRFSYWVGAIVSLAFLYNFWVIIFRFSFSEINQETQFMWMICDYTADTLYILDILFNFHTGFLEEGVLQTDPIRIRHHYMNTTRFYVDCLCLLPLDILYLSFGYKSIFRCFRLVKVYKLMALLERTERHFSYPNLFQSFVLIKNLFFIFHWNACISHLLVKYLSPNLNSHLNNQNNYATNHSNLTQPVNDYLKEFYSSIKLMKLVTAIPNPTTNQDYIYSIFQSIVAIILFAYIMGNVGQIVNNLSNARKEFQSKLDAVKRYMSIRRVPKRLQTRVIKWFDFLWLNRQSTDDNEILGLLPYKLRAEIAIHVHLDTLKRVEIFQNTEAGFLNELVLRLKPVLFSPGDFICRKGEVGKEMYIVNSGKLQVMSDNGKIILATLKAGSYFGEISILNMGAHGNRRTASVKSVGYSDLFCLSKEDLWEVLKEYPAVRVKLEAIAVKRLEKHKKPLSEIINLSRSKSMSCLDNKTKPVITDLKRHCTLPANLLKRTDISLLYTNSSSIIKFRPKTRSQLAYDKKNDNKSKSYASEIGLMNDSLQLVNSNNETNPVPNILIQNEAESNNTNNNNRIKAIQNVNTNINTSTKSKAVVLDLKRSESDLKSNSTNLQLMQEIEKLKRMVDYLKAENDNLKKKNFYSTKSAHQKHDEHQDIEIQMELNN